MVGAAIGARIAHTISREMLKNIVAWVLVIVGFFMVIRLAQ